MMERNMTHLQSHSVNHCHEAAAIAMKLAGYNRIYSDTLALITLWISLKRLIFILKNPKNITQTNSQQRGFSPTPLRRPPESQQKKKTLFISVFLIFALCMCNYMYARTCVCVCVCVCVRVCACVTAKIRNNFDATKKKSPKYFKELITFVYLSALPRSI